ncbi:oxidoreductase 2-nitropropane dioxygenase family [Microthyrium microscopicum]|uniref:Oxidoreductase 2-nitropropane dioxygenase family n=1 Tax=Microthyrium microscopicum TaxID=703497 RepID=A0A6A6U9T0_9PEZI|nr:oxidoreductase 2-nitropropane dioxygenase family [Microthyrium microscopicum]
MAQTLRSLRAIYPWISTPLIVQAPMKALAGPQLAVAVSSAGGIGFLGPGDKPETLLTELQESKSLIEQSSLKKHLTSSTPILPIGFGIQTWTGDLPTTTTVLSKVAPTHPPAIAWLFAPRHGQTELDEWTHTFRTVSPSTKIWIQVASVADALAAASSAHAPDVLVLQGTDAGGHSRTTGAGIATLLPETADALARAGHASIPLIAAGGLADARGAAAMHVLGASGTAMGTRFLATPEARINRGYQRAILAGSDGGQTTVRTQLYNHLRGTMGWPSDYDARGLVNASWRDHMAGVTLEENQKMHVEALRKGEDAWGEERGRTATYAGTGVGLIQDVKDAAQIVREVREGMGEILGLAVQRLTE